MSATVGPWLSRPRIKSGSVSFISVFEAAVGVNLWWVVLRFDKSSDALFRRLLTSRLCRTFISNHDLGSPEGPLQGPFQVSGSALCPVLTTLIILILPQGKEKNSPYGCHALILAGTSEPPPRLGHGAIVSSCPVLLDINVRHLTFPPSKHCSNSLQTLISCSSWTP